MADFDESKHARDAQGRFAQDGAEGASKNIGPAKGLKAFANKHAEGDPTKPFATYASAGGSDKKAGRNWSDNVPEGMTKETWQAHYDAHPDKGGKPSAERVASVHDPIKREALNVAPAAPGEQKMAIMTMGAPASGKSSMLKGVDTSKFVKVDPDAIKEALPEYQKATRDPTNTYRGAAAMAHEESSHIAKQIMSEAIARGNHVIIDGTGADAGKFIQKMDALKAAGYHVHVAMPHLDVQQGMQRMADRAEKTGRYVPAEFVKAAYESIPQNFSKIAAKADSAHLFDASGKSGARMVYEKKAGGEEVHHDKSFVDAFRAKHG